MGTGEGAAGDGRAGHRLSPVVAAALAAAGIVVGGAAAARRHRRRQTAITSPHADALPAADRTDRTADTLAGPTIDPGRRTHDTTDGPTHHPDRRTADTLGAATIDPGRRTHDTADGPTHHPDRRTADTLGAAKVVVDPPVAVAADVRAMVGGPVVTPRRRTGSLVAGLVGLVLVLVTGALVAGGTGGTGDDEPARTVVAADDSGPVTRRTTSTTVPPVTAVDVFATAGQRLTAAGSFSYAGTVRATDVSDVRPTLWLAVDAVVEGQVATSTGRLHEIAVATGGAAAETTTDGPRVWGRRAPAVEDLADEPYEAVPALSSGTEPKGAALLPAWLAAAVDPVEGAADDRGRRTFQAVLPAEVLGEIERDRRPVDAAVVLTVDAAGDPVRVEITSAPQGPALRLVYEISDLGAPVTIDPPA